MATVGSAKIEFEADASGVSAELESQLDKALSTIDGLLNQLTTNVEQGAQRAGGAVGDDISQGASRAEAAINGVGADAFGSVEQAAAQVSSSIVDDMSDAAQRSDSALAGVDGDGMSGATSSASSASSAVANAMQEAAQLADSALTGVDGDGFMSATSAASSAASSVAGRFSEEAGRANASLLRVDGDGFTTATSAASRAASSMSDSMGDSASRSSRQWRDATEDIADSARRSASEVEGAFSGIGGKITAGVGGFMALAGATNVVGDAFAKNTSIEDTSAVLEVLTGSAEEATKTMDDLVESNWDTPIKFDLWADAGKTLVAFGMDTADVSETVTALGEAAAASGAGEEGLQRLSRAFGQSMATGVMQGDTLNQLMESGVPALDILGNHYGKTADEMKKMASEGLPAEEAIAVLTEGIMEGTDGAAGSTAAFEGTMSKLAGTTSGVLGNLGAAFVNVVSTAIDPFLGILRGVAKWLTVVTYKFQGVIKWFQQGGIAADILTAAFAGLATTVGIVVGINMARALAGWARSLMSTKFASDLLNMSLLKNPWTWVIGGIVALIGIFITLWKNVDGFREFWQNLWQQIQDAMAPVIDWIQEKFELVKNAWGELVSAFTGGDDGYGALAELIGVDAAEWVMNTITNIQGAWGELTTALSGGDDGYGALAELIGMDAAEWVMGAITNVQDAWEGLTALIFEGDFTGAFRNAFGLEEDDPIVGKILTWREALMDLPDFFSGIADILFKGDYTGLPFGFEEDGTFAGILFGIRDAVIDVWEAIGDLWDTLVEVGKVFAAAWWETAKTVFESLWTVVQSLWGVFTSLAGAIWKIIQAVAPVLLPILKTVGIIVGGIIVGAFFALMGALRVVAKLFEVVAKVVGWLVENVLSPLISVIAEVVGWLAEKLGGALEWVADLIGTVFENIGPALEEAWQWIQDTWSDLTEWLAGAWEGLQALWDEYGQPVVDFVVDAFTRIWDFLSLVFRLVGAAWEVLLTALGKAWEAWGQPAVDFIVAGFGLLWDGIQVVLGWIKAGWDLLWTGIQWAWSTFGQPVVDLIVRVFNIWWSGISTIFGWLRDGWDKLWNFVSNAWASYGQPVIDKVAFAFEWVKLAIQRVLWNIRNYIDLAGFVIRSLWSKYVQPMIDWVTDGFNDLMDTVKGWKDNVIGWFSDAGSWLYNAGKDIIQGLIDGAQSLLKNIGNFFLDVLPDWVKDPFKRALGIESPSKVFMEYGRNIGEGVVAGISGMHDAVGGAVSDLAGAAERSIVMPDVVPSGAPVSVPVAPAVGGEVGANPLAGVAGEMSGMAESMSAVSSGLLDPMWTQQGEQMRTLANTATTTLRDGVSAAWTNMSSHMLALREGVVSPVMSAIQSDTGAMSARFVGEVNNAINPIMSHMGAHIANTRATVVDPAMRGMQNAMGATAGKFMNDINNSINPVMSSMGSHIVNIKANNIDPAFDGIRSGMQSVADAFGNGARDVGRHMNDLRRNAEDPIRFTMNTVFADGLVEMWNSTSEMIGTTPITKRYASFATGGIMPGYSPGRDIHRFFSPTGGVLDLSGGEPVLRPEVGKVLGSDWVHGINSAASAEGTEGVSRFLEHQHFSRGGIMKFARGGYIPQTPFFGGGVSAIGRSHEAFVERFFPGVFTLTSANRPGDPGHHGAGRATDWQDSGAQWPTPNSKALSRAIAKTYPDSLELIHWPTDGWSNIKNGRPATYDAGTNRDHANHVHWATAGPVSADGIGLDSLAVDWSDFDWSSMLRSWVQPDLDSIDSAINAQSFSGKLGKTPRASYDTALDPMLETMTEAMKSSMMPQGGHGLEKWRPLAMQALQRHGYNPLDYIDAMMQQIWIESKGDPTAINRWDSNWLRGTPSQGLLQVIDPTYRRIRRSYPEAFKGLPDDMLFPLTNLTAGVGAVRQDWGGPAGRWPTRDGYEHGGLMPEGQGWFQKTAIKPERVLSPRQTGAFERLVDDAIDRQQGGDIAATPTARGRDDYAEGRVVREVHVTQNIHTSDAQRTADVIEDRLLRLV